jgi:hypothetical protein
MSALRRLLPRAGEGGGTVLAFLMEKLTRLPHLRHIE